MQQDGNLVTSKGWLLLAPRLLLLLLLLLLVLELLLLLLLQLLTLVLLTRLVVDFELFSLQKGQVSIGVTAWAGWAVVAAHTCTCTCTIRRIIGCGRRHGCRESSGHGRGVRVPVDPVGKAPIAQVDCCRCCTVVRCRGCLCSCCCCFLVFSCSFKSLGFLVLLLGPAVLGQGSCQFIMSTDLVLAVLPVPPGRLGRKDREHDGGCNKEQGRDNTKRRRGKHSLTSADIVGVRGILPVRQDLARHVRHSVRWPDDSSDSSENPESDGQEDPGGFKEGTHGLSRLLAENENEGDKGGEAGKGQGADCDRGERLSIGRLWVGGDVEANADGDDYVGEEGADLDEEEGDGSWHERHG